MSVSLEKLADLIEQAEDMADDLFEQTKYWFYQTLSSDLKDMQRELEKQSITEARDEEETRL